MKSVNDMNLEQCLSSCNTPKQYESLSKNRQSNDGWIKWNGGECPVPKGTPVDVRHGDGTEHIKAIAGAERSAANSWVHIAGHEYGNIVAWRLHQPDQQACSAEWNGEGLPPVGTECELKFEHWSEWERYNILCIGKRRVFVSHVTRSGEISEGAMSLDGVMFRPIRTDEERKREEAETELRLCLVGTGAGITPLAAKEIYNAIAAGKIPGVKLED